jgi:hypothetical protein
MLILATFWRSSCLYKFGFDGCILWEVKEALLKNMLSFKAGFEIIYQVWFIRVHVVCKVYNMSCVECLLFCSGSLARCVFRKVHFDWVCPSLSFLQWNSKVLRAYSVRFMIFYTMRKCKFCDLFLDGFGWSFSYLFFPLWIYKIESITGFVFVRSMPPANFLCILCLSF